MPKKGLEISIVQSGKFRGEAVQVMTGTQSGGTLACWRGWRRQWYMEGGQEEVMPDENWQKWRGETLQAGGTV